MIEGRCEDQHGVLRSEGGAGGTSRTAEWEALVSCCFLRASRQSSIYRRGYRPQPPPVSCTHTCTELWASGFDLTAVIGPSESLFHRHQLPINIENRARSRPCSATIARHRGRQATGVVAPPRFRSALEAQIGRLLSFSGRSCPSPGYISADPEACGLSSLLSPPSAPLWTVLRP